MTEELFREDSYLKTCDAMVVAVGEEGVVLDRTVFYPAGGGHCDRLVVGYGGTLRLLSVARELSGIKPFPEPASGRLR